MALRRFPFGRIPGTGKIQHGNPDFDSQVIQPTKGEIAAIGGFWGSCSGVLVSPRCVLTANHCDIGLGWPFVGGPSLSFANPHPYGLVTDALPYAFGVVGEDIANDLHLVRLNKDTSSVATPIAIGSATGLERVTIGDREFSFVQAVGYGKKGSGEPYAQSARTWVVGMIDWHDSDDFALVVRFDDLQNVCFGDSGGPLLAMVDGRLVVVGILSRLIGALAEGVDECLGTDAGYTRLDQPDVMSWVSRISAYMDSSEDCADDPRPSSCPDPAPVPVPVVPVPPEAPDRIVLSPSSRGSVVPWVVGGVLAAIAGIAIVEAGK